MNLLFLAIVLYPSKYLAWSIGFKLKDPRTSLNRNNSFCENKSRFVASKFVVGCHDLIPRRLTPVPDTFCHALTGSGTGDILALGSVQDFLIKLDIKPLMHLLEMSTFSLNNVIVRLTKIMNRADKNWAHF